MYNHCLWCNDTVVSSTNIPTESYMVTLENVTKDHIEMHMYIQYF